MVTSVLCFKALRLEVPAKENRSALCHQLKIFCLSTKKYLNFDILLATCLQSEIFEYLFWHCYHLKLRLACSKQIKDTGRFSAKFRVGLCHPQFQNATVG